MAKDAKGDFASSRPRSVSMTSDTPWSSDKTIAELSRQPVGRALATRIAAQLQTDDGKRGLWVSHRDYCGHGLVYRTARYRLVEYSDGDIVNGEQLIAWDKSDDFISWLERQSDYSLSGAVESEPDLFTDSPSKRNNQRITVVRLQDYLYGIDTAALAVFRDFLVALGEEFEFLTKERGFNRVRPRIDDSRRCVARYRHASAGSIIVAAEFRQTPLLTVESSSKQPGQAHDSVPLTALATARVPGWTPPTLEYRGNGNPDYQKFCRDYAELLRAHLTILLPEQSTRSAGRQPSRSTESESHSMPPAPKTKVIKARISGAAIMLIGFALLIAELRYFYGNDLPEASGNPRGNLGLLALLGLPCVIFAVGLVQVFCGNSLRQLPTAFSDLKVSRRVVLAAATLVITAAAILLAASIA